jgi:hypothetical protein
MTTSEAADDRAARWLSVLASANARLKDRGIAMRCVIGVLIAGAALRFAWLVFHGFRVSPTEATYEAAAFATTGELADAYGPGTGLTAHLSPGMPLLVGTVYHWFGVGAPAAEFILACLSLAFIFVSLLALDRAFEILGAAPAARMGAIALLALLLFNLYDEMAEFRHWEGSLAAAWIAVSLGRALQLDVG